MDTTFAQPYRFCQLFLMRHTDSLTHELAVCQASVRTSLGNGLVRRSNSYWRNFRWSVRTEIPSRLAACVRLPAYWSRALVIARRSNSSIVRPVGISFGSVAGVEPSAM